MNWREKIRGFGGIGGIEHGGKKVQSLNNNININLPKDYFRDSTPYAQNSQNTQNLKKQEIPAPNPPGLGPEYEKIWDQAWPLADWIDDPAGAPLADRKARLPELLMMRDRMAELERQGGTGSTTTEGRTPEYCPAKCKRTGECYGKAYFEGRPGKSSVCMIDCPWIEKQKET